MDPLNEIFQKEYHELNEFERNSIRDLCDSEQEFDEVKAFYAAIDEFLLEEIPAPSVETKKSLDALFVEKHKEKSILWYNSMLTLVFTKEKKWHEQTIVRIAAVLLLVFSVFPFLNTSKTVEQSKQVAQLKQEKQENKIEKSESKSTEKVSVTKNADVKTNQSQIETRTDKKIKSNPKPILMAKIESRKEEDFQDNAFMKINVDKALITKAFSMQENSELFDLLSPTF